MVSIPVALLCHSGAQEELHWGAVSASCGFISTLSLAVNSASMAVGGARVFFPRVLQLIILHLSLDLLLSSTLRTQFRQRMGNHMPSCQNF